MTERDLPDAGSAAAGAFERVGATIHYWASGDSDAPAVVCTHGVTLDHGAFEAQVPALVAAGYRVVTWDLRGHGVSRPAGQRLSIAVAAEDLLALLDELGIERAVLVAQSFGGFVAQELYRRTPQRVRALVLVGTPALEDRPARRLQRVLARSRPYLLRAWPERHLRDVIPRAMSRQPEVRRYVAQATQALSKRDLVQTTEAALEGLLRQGAPVHIGVPVLLVHGDSEDAMVARMVRAWAARLPHAEHEIVSGAGHLANQDRPHAFNELLLSFLRREESG